MSRLKLGMVGGGQGAFIGGVHRIASRIDDRFELVAGALSSDPERAKASAVELGISADRSYASYEEMATAEAAREDGIDAVAIVTPNHMHAGPAIAFLNAGINVICDKPLAATSEQAAAIAEAAAGGKAKFVLTHNYTGYPLVRYARKLIAEGFLGELRLVHAEYVQDWLATPLESEGQKQASWRTDPKQAGAGAIGDIGSHAFNLLEFVSGLKTEKLAAELDSMVPGRLVDDNAQILLRMNNGAKGSIWVSQVAPGHENDLRLRIYGEKASIEWSQEEPNKLWYAPLGGSRQLITRGTQGPAGAVDEGVRVPPGHPEGYLEAFANIYNEAADLIQGGSAGALPDIQSGLDGMWFIDACLESSAGDLKWVSRS